MMYKALDGTINAYLVSKYLHLLTFIYYYFMYDSNIFIVINYVLFGQIFLAKIVSFSFKESIYFYLKEALFTRMNFVFCIS